MMKALMISKHKDQLEWKDVPTPEPKENEVLVRIYASGVCHTDIHAVDGDWEIPTILPLIPGHEGVGVVVKKGMNVSHV